MCMHVSVYVCCVCMHVCMHVCVHVCCVCVYVCMHVCCVCVCMCVCIVCCVSAPLRESDLGWMYMTKDSILKLQVYKRLPETGATQRRRYA